MMFREMRRNRQLLSEKESISVLAEATSGVLAVSGDGGYPYAVPLSYVYEDGKIYFHCAKEGHKLDALKKDPKASFCVIGQDHVVPEEYTSYFRSVIAFGTVRVIEDGTEARRAIEKLAAKYALSGEVSKNAIEKDLPRVCMLELKIEHMTGKEARELAASKSRPKA